MPELKDFIEKERDLFRKKFLAYGSSCTWQTYPEPEEIEEHIRQSHKRLLERVIQVINEEERFHADFTTNLELTKKQLVHDIEQMIKEFE